MIVKALYTLLYPGNQKVKKLIIGDSEKRGEGNFEVFNKPFCCEPYSPLNRNIDKISSSILYRFSKGILKRKVNFSIFTEPLNIFKNLPPPPILIYL